MLKRYCRVCAIAFGEPYATRFVKICFNFFLILNYIEYTVLRMKAALLIKQD